MADHNPGPLDGSVLYNQENHISEQIWKGKERGPLRAIPVNSKEDTWELNEDQWELIRRTGLHHLAKIEKIKIDHSLISALVERWRPETNTFHLNSGEATITLEDVAHIYGLLIDGPPVTGRAFSSFDQVQYVCNDLLGMAPDVNYDCNGVQIKLKWIRDNFAGAPKTRIKDYDQRRTRAYLFSLVAGQIISSSGGSGAAYILELFRKFEKYAWGSARLANLYRNLAKITTVSKAGKPIRGKRNKGKDEEASSKTLTGPLQLLQRTCRTFVRRLSMIAMCGRQVFN